MKKAQLTISSPNLPRREVELSGNTSIGRACDNTISIESAGISRYHALIEEHGNGYWLSDLGSVNGTIVNGQRLVSTKRLSDGDTITLGESQLIFHCLEASQNIDESGKATGKDSGQQQVIEGWPVVSTSLPSTHSSASSKRLILMIVTIGVALAAVVIMLVIRTSIKPQSSRDIVRIISPQTGITVRSPIKVQLEVKSPKKIERIIYQLDGVAFESVDIPPYDINLDPARLLARFPALGVSNHVLSITVESPDGSKQLQSDTLLLAFEIKDSTLDTADKKLSDKDLSPNGDTEELLNTGKSRQTGAVDIAALAQNLAGQISQKSGYIFNPQLTERIYSRSAEYRINMISDARRYRREIIKAFRDKGLHPLFGFVLATSQSRFKTDSTTMEGLAIWHIPPQIARAYLAAGETESTFNDPKRAAEIAAAYTKDLINLFGLENFMYAVSCYGMSLDQAGQIRLKLEEANTKNDYWRMVEIGVVPRSGAEQVINFFAAGIVGENPQLFGLQTERLSSLY
ncbi:MAG: FHA domain-containing protein [Acidobacteriota bacterium]